ncbi:MAG: DUF4019 domain-containing protein [Pyrinomonadaceae bacterium]
MKEAMKEKGEREKAKVRTGGRYLNPIQFFLFPFYFFLLSLAFASCALRANRDGVPSAVQSAISSLSDDMAEGRYEKIYNESAQEWRRDSTLDQSNAVFKTLQTKLGRVSNRALHTATERDDSSGPLPGHTFTLSYQTKFERADGMETFTLVEREGRWMLARYFVNSTALR